jgi:hypothetical protein
LIFGKRWIKLLLKQRTRVPNLHKEARNAEIVRLFDNGRGLTHRQLAEKFGMKTSAVSMVIVRWNTKIKKGESQSDESSE